MSIFLGVLAVIFLFMVAGGFVAFIAFAAQFEEARREAERNHEEFNEQATTERLLQEMAEAFRKTPWPFGPTDPGSF